MKKTVPFAMRTVSPIIQSGLNDPPADGFVCYGLFHSDASEGKYPCHAETCMPLAGARTKRSTSFNKISFICLSINKSFIKLRSAQPSGVTSKQFSEGDVFSNTQ